MRRKEGRKEGRECGTEEGRKGGRKEGRKEGKEEGREGGRNEGMKERRKKRRREGEKKQKAYFVCPVYCAVLRNTIIHFIPGFPVTTNFYNTSSSSSRYRYTT